MTQIASGLNPDKPISCAQGRYGEVIIAQGGGLQPKRWGGAGSCTNAGISAPVSAPGISLSFTKRYYVARVDVVKPGAVYNAPPSLTFSAHTQQPDENVQASADAYLSQSVIGEVIVRNGGKHYSEPPSISLSNTHGTGAVLTAVMDGTPPNPTSITHYEIIQGPPYDDEGDVALRFRSVWTTWGGVEIPLTNGSGTITRTTWIFHGGADGDPNNIANYWQYTTSLPYTVSGVKTGASGAIASVNFYGQAIEHVECNGNICNIYGQPSCFVRSVTMRAAGTGYDPATPVRIEIPSVRWNTSTFTVDNNPPSKTLIIEGYPPAHAKNTSTPRFSIKSITVTNGGSGYIVAPDIQIDSPSGFGAYATCEVSNGVITQVDLHTPGGGYKFAPTVTAVSGGAELSAVSRPHLRGKYQCYYRYVDNTDADHGGPIPSNLSPAAEADAGDGAQSMTWTVTHPNPTDGRSLTLELWRTTSNQAVMLYRVAKTTDFADNESGGKVNAFIDDLTDEEVRDPDRTGYAAMPIVLPNGDLNAMRFSRPPADKSAVVRYQDRFWYAVDTSGTEPNTIYFSEVDEPESVPDINQFVLQQNARDGDFVTALVPFGTSMLVMQSRHAYSLSFSKQPLRDADVTPLAYRGCLNQRCWDIHAGLCYAMDQSGIYSITPQGGVQELSAPIDDLFRTQIDWAHATWYFVVADPVKKVLRAFVAFSDDNSNGYPTRALCYSVATKTWWIERYPHRLSCGASLPVSGGRYRCAYGGRGGFYMLDEGHSDAARGAVLRVTVTNKGAGYRTPPKVTASGGSGAEFSAAINADGQVSGIWIISPGYDYTSGSLTISAPNDPDCAAPSQATATFVASNLSVDTPIAPVYRYRTGNRAFPTDMTSQRDATSSARDVVITYRPQPAKCEMGLRLYYNNSPHPRPYVAARNRGVGFVPGTIDGAARFDMGALTPATGRDSGVAKALLAGRAVDDIQSSDRHVAVELLGARTTTEPVVIHALDVYGTSAPQE